LWARRAVAVEKLVAIRLEEGDSELIHGVSMRSAQHQRK
jgi:hypothetical protein